MRPHINLYNVYNHVIQRTGTGLSNDDPTTDGLIITTGSDADSSRITLSAIAFVYVYVLGRPCSIWGVMFCKVSWLKDLKYAYIDLMNYLIILVEIK